MKSYDENEFVWSMRYRPQTIDDCILPDQLKKTFKQIVTQGELQSLLLSGIQGSGKTTVAKALCNDMGLDSMIINASEENGIDTLRTKIKQFASTVSIADSGSHKVVILDESDYLNCLEENEQILMADGSYSRLKDLNSNTGHSVISFNIEKQVFEEDMAYIIKDKIDDVYEVEFSDGTVIQVTADHPFIVKDVNGNIVEMTLTDCDFDVIGVEFICMAPSD